MMTPLSITVKGIILSHSVNKSIVMVADQTNKESIYHVGDKIQDGQIIKITTNKMIVLRSNGQLETFYLRKPEKLKPGLALWEYAIKKIDDATYHVDPAELSKAISSVGELVEALNLSAEYAGDTPVGVRLDTIEHHPLGKHLGLQEGDIITSINSLPTTGTKELIRVYDELSALPLDSRLDVALSRGTEKKTVAYLLKKLRKPSPFEAAANASSNDEDQSGDKELFKLGKDAQRRQNRREFAHDHRTVEQRAAARGDMRKRLLENMRKRAPNRRVR
jgi:type II secretion system protein C